MCDAIFAKPFPSESSVGGLSSFEKEILDAHNASRSKFASGWPSLVWDPKLAAAAAAWNQTMCSNRSWVHSRLPYGVNLAIGTSGSRAVDLWFDEYKALAPYVNDPSVYYNHAGHFTQVVWKDTTAVGCDVFACPQAVRQDFPAGIPMVTCEYSPAGNIYGAFAINVPAIHVSSLVAKAT